MKLALMVVVLSLLISNGFTASKNKGETGLSFLKIGVDARAVGMGEAYTAVSEDASAVYWDIDVRADVPTEDPLETTSAHYLSTGISYARRFSRNLSAGVTVKYLFEKIYVESASGLAADFGLTYRTPFQNVKVGAVLQNLGKMGKFQNEETALPVIGRLGFLYNLPLKTESVTALLAADIVKPSSENIRFHLGTEVLVWNQIALRGGYLFGYEARNFALGLGFVRSAIRLDYGITPFWDDLGTTHRFSVNFNL
ncbi:MAG: PorV/PorQ family protein [Calditrichota bacterium]